MIQRPQSLFFFLAAISLITIMYRFPVLQTTESSYTLINYFPLVRFLILASAGLSVFIIFQFKNRKRQLLLSGFARLLITVSFFLLVFVLRENRSFGLGTFLLFIPYLSLIAANFFIKKDEKLIKSADRIR